jgi:hypothetical protein
MHQCGACIIVCQSILWERSRVRGEHLHCSPPRFHQLPERQLCRPRCVHGIFRLLPLAKLRLLMLPARDKTLADGTSRASAGGFWVLVHDSSLLPPKLKRGSGFDGVDGTSAIFTFRPCRRCRCWLEACGFGPDRWCPRCAYRSQGRGSPSTQRASRLTTGNTTTHPSYFVNIVDTVWRLRVTRLDPLVQMSTKRRGREVLAAKLADFVLWGVVLGRVGTSVARLAI